MTSHVATRAEQRAVLAAATLASFLTPFLSSSINVALPAIGADLGMHSVQLSWVATSFLLAAAVCLVPFGRVADLVGRKRIFVTGLVVFTAASGACALARHAGVLMAGRTIQGLGAAMMFGTGVALLTSLFPAQQRGRVLGLNASAVYLGLSLGPFAGGLLTRHFGWQSIFLAPVPLGVVASIVAWRQLRTDAGAPSHGSFDVFGTLLYGTTLIALMAGLSALPRSTGLALLAIALLAGGAFVARERRSPQPMLDIPLLAANPVFAWSNVAALVSYSATTAVAFVLSLYLQNVRGLDPARAGVVLLTPSVMMAVTSPFAGRLSDRIEPRIVASAGMAATVAGLAWLAAIDASTSLGAIIAGLMVVGTGFGLFSSPNTNAVMSAVSPSQYGVASATLGTMRLLGQTASMGIAAAVLAIFVGRQAITRETSAAFLTAIRLVFAGSAGLCLLGVFASLARGNVRPGRGRAQT